MSRRDKAAQAEVVPSGAAVPACTKAGAATGAEPKAVSMGVVVDAVHEAASMGVLRVSLFKTGRQQARASGRSGASLSLI